MGLGNDKTPISISSTRPSSFLPGKRGRVVGSRETAEDLKSFREDIFTIDRRLAALQAHRHSITMQTDMLHCWQLTFINQVSIEYLQRKILFIYPGIDRSGEGEHAYPNLLEQLDSVTFFDLIMMEGWIRLLWWIGHLMLRSIWIEISICILWWNGVRIARWMWWITHWWRWRLIERLTLLLLFVSRWLHRNHHHVFYKESERNVPLKQSTILCLTLCLTTMFAPHVNSDEYNHDQKKNPAQMNTTSRWTTKRYKIY